MVLIAAVLALLPLLAQADQLWSVHAFGLRVGELTVDMQENGARYSAKSQFKTTGLAGVVATIRFDIEASGARAGDVFDPALYRGNIHTGRRQSVTALDFSGAVPHKTEGDDAPAVPIDDAALIGAIDPMTMMWQVLRSRATPCRVDGTQYDGTRLVAIRLLRSRQEGENLVCEGAYHRLGGYTQEELDEITVTPLEVTFARSGDVWRAEKVWVKTRHGPATLKRRDTQE